MSSVSIVLPIIRITPQLPDVLYSILHQTYPPTHFYIIIQSEDLAVKKALISSSLITPHPAI